MVFYLDKNPTVEQLKMMVADLYEGVNGVPEHTKRRAQAVRDQYSAAHKRLVNKDQDGFVMTALINFLDTLEQDKEDKEKAQGLKVFLLDTLDRGNITPETYFKIEMFINAFKANNLINMKDIMQLNTLTNRSLSN